jgi:hypothetical protein
MKVPSDPGLGQINDLRGMAKQLTLLWRNLAQQINGLSEGSVVAFYNARTAAPTEGTHGQGDFVPNKEPVEMGSPGSKYIVRGWVCIAAGTPGTWVEARSLTGN